MSSRHNLGYFDLNPRPAASTGSLWRAAAVTATGLAALGAAAAVITSNIKHSDATVAAYKASPVLLVCKDHITGSRVEVRRADLQANPQAIKLARHSFDCPQ